MDDPHIVPTVLAVFVIVSTAVWALALHVGSRPRRPPAGSPTMDLAAEPPAVVDLITDDFVVTPEAVPATLVDLAARRWLSIEEVGGGDVIIRLRTSDPEQPLEAYERRVLDHLRGLAVDGVVPAAAMTTGPEAASTRWWRAFRREVIADAQARGLCRDRWTKAMLAPIGAGVLGAGGLLWLAVQLGRPHDPEAPADPVSTLWVLVLVGTIGFGAWAFSLVQRGLQRDTNRGLAAATSWVGVREHMSTVGDFEDKPAAMVTLWDRYLAYAVALDLAPLVVAQLPLGAEDHRQAWSRASGRWRQVRVRYPWMRPGYGQHPVVALLGAAAVGVGAAFVLRFAMRLARNDVAGLTDASGQELRNVHLAAAALGALAIVVLVWNVAKLLAAVADLATTTQCEGVVVRSRVRHGWAGLTEHARPSSDDRVKERFFCALDTGESTDIAAWRVRREIFDQLQQGNRYRVQVTPRLGYVREVAPA